MTRPKLAQIPTTTLKNSINSTDTTIVLTSLKATRSIQVEFGDLFGKATLAPTTSSEEIVSFTGLTIATDGTATLTGVTRNLSPIHPYTTLGAGSGHSAGTQVSFSNNPQLYEAILDYVDSVAISGAPDASIITKGIVKLSVAPNSASNPIAVGDNDPRLPTQDEKDGIAGLSAINRPIQGDTITQSGKGGAIGEQTSSVDSQKVGETNATTRRHRLAFRFTPTKGKIRGVELFKKANTGTFTGTVTIALQTDIGASPSGTDIVSKVFTNAEWLALSNDAAFEAVFASEFDLLDLTLNYWIVITTSTSDNSNNINFGSRNAGGNSTAKYFNTTDGWVTLSNTDLYYKIMEGNVEQVVKTGVDGFINYALVKATKTRIYDTPTGVSRGNFTSQYDITNPSGSTFRYTYDGNGTNPNITSATVPVGSLVEMNTIANSLSESNISIFKVINSGTNFFEVNNPSGVAEDNITFQLIVHIEEWTKPDGLKQVLVELWGGGGGGVGGRNNTTATAVVGGAGGAGGAYSFQMLQASDLDATEIIAVGAGGAGSNGVASGSTINGSNANNGTASSFGRKTNAFGGRGGQYSGNTNEGGAGGGSTLQRGLGIRGGRPDLFTWIPSGTTSNVANNNNIGFGGGAGGTSSGGNAEYGGAGSGNNSGASGGSSIYGGSAGGSGARTGGGGNAGRRGSYITGAGAIGTAENSGGTAPNGVNFGDGGAGGGRNTIAMTKGTNGGNGNTAGGGGGGGSSINDGGGGDGGNGGNGFVRITEFY